MRIESIVATILYRERYRRDRMNYLVRMVTITAGLVLLMVVADLAQAWRAVGYKYLLADTSGRLIKVVPLEEPNMADAAVAAWSVDAITRVYTFDFLNYRRQFQTAQDVLTQAGWQGFTRSIKDSGNFVAVTENRYVTTAVPNGPPRILSSGALADNYGNVRWSWVVEFPMLLTYRSAKLTTSQDLTVRMVVVRMPEFINKDGLGIRSVIAK